MKALFKKILCPIDLGDQMTGSLDLACDLAQGPDTTVCILYVIPLVLSSAPNVDPLPISETDARIQLEMLARAHLEGKVSYELYTKIGGQPADVILKAIADLGVDSVIMPTHGRKGVGRLILGSVAERVVRESPRPVLTIRATPNPA